LSWKHFILALPRKAVLLSASQRSGLTVLSFYYISFAFASILAAMEDLEIKAPEGNGPDATLQQFGYEQGS
jgi:hypothetical protein